MGLANAYGVRTSVRTPDSSSSENKSPANCHWLDRSKLLIMAWIFGTFFWGAPWLDPSGSTQQKKLGGAGVFLLFYTV